VVDELDVLERRGVGVSRVDGFGSRRDAEVDVDLAFAAEALHDVCALQARVSQELAVRD
jgi:hypothetical protein